uniref:O-phosphoseryl-tRNA(Sec) selenium transferase n=1 Tax=Trypanosoma vivax (strain Y486) TaxID=1055687 RepID=G0U8I2_TRYVY|nr:conserved hypothetical protein, fragment [Trypanosoma vivax Y486]
MSDVAINLLLHQLALMDANNFSAHVGAGEREGRIAAALVERRHYGFAHGIGRSGDLCSDQPKAAGSSLLYKLTNNMMLDLLRLAGTPSLESAVVIPMATGMTLTLVLRSVAQQRREELRCTVPPMAAAEGQAQGGVRTCSDGDASAAQPRYVIWTRIDQKTALKCVELSGLEPVVVPLRHARVLPLRNGGDGNKSIQRDRSNNVDGISIHRGSTDGGTSEAESVLHTYFLQAHVDDVSAAIERVGGRKNVLCVLSTTSCFAPRLPDDVVAISKLCKTLDIPYVVNNAYGVQSRQIMQRIDAAIRIGRVDAVVQSGDKNFLVPVGGSVLSGTKKAVACAAALYAGRASASPIIDLFITALCAVTGPRVVVPSAKATQLCGQSFLNYGMHTDDTPPCPLLVMACGIGMSPADLTGIMERLEVAWPVGAGAS